MAGCTIVLDAVRIKTFLEVQFRGPVSARNVINPQDCLPQKQVFTQYTGITVPPAFKFDNITISLLVNDDKLL